MVAIEIRDQPHAVEVTGLPSGPPTFRGGLFSQTSSGPLAFAGGLSSQMPSDPPAFVGGLSSQMSPSWGNLAFAVRNSLPLFASGHAFQVHSDTQNQLVSSDSRTTSEFQEPSTGAPTYLSITASSTDSASQVSPPPGAPPPMPGLPPGAFPPLDLFRFKVDLIVRAHGFEAKPLPEANAGNVAGETEGAQGGTTAISPGSQGVGVVTAGNTIAQVAPPMIVAPAHLTALLGSDTGRGDSLIQPVRTNEAPGNQIMEAGRGSLSNTSSTHLVATDAPVTMAAAHPDDKPPLPVSLPNGNQEEIPLPHAAGLMADVLPFDRASLEHAVDQFFDQLEDLGVGQLPEPGLRVLPLSLTVIGAVAVEDCPTTVTVQGQWWNQHTATGRSRE